MMSLTDTEVVVLGMEDNLDILGYLYMVYAGPAAAPDIYIYIYIFFKAPFLFFLNFLLKKKKEKYKI